MEIHKTEKQVKEVEVTIERYRVCDKCGKKKDHANDGNYDAFDCELSIKTGVSYPEGGHGEDKEMELCKPCSEDLVKLLEENGYKLTERDWFW